MKAFFKSITKSSAKNIALQELAKDYTVNVPEEILKEIFKFLRWTDLTNIKKVNKRWSKAANDKQINPMVIVTAEQSLHEAIDNTFNKGAMNLGDWLFGAKRKLKEQTKTIMNTLFELINNNANIVAYLQERIRFYNDNPVYVKALRDIQQKAIELMTAEQKQTYLNELANNQLMSVGGINLTDVSREKMQEILLISLADSVEGKLAYIQFVVQKKHIYEQDVMQAANYFTAIKAEPDKLSISKDALTELEKRLKQLIEDAQQEREERERQIATPAFFLFK